MRRVLPLIAVVVLSLFALLPAAAQSCSGMSLGRAANLNGFVPFPADNAWNQDISAAPIDPNSDNYINFIGNTTPLHPDFGAGLYGGQTIGIPYMVVSGSPFVNNHLHGLWQRKRPRTHGCSEDCSHRGLSESGEWRSSRPGPRPRQLLALRAVSLLPCRRTEPGTPILEPYGIC